MLSNNQLQLLNRIAACKRFPVARLELRSTKDSSLRSVALDNVILSDKNDSMDMVKELGTTLAQLEEMELVQIDFALKVAVSSDYTIFRESDIYAQLCELAEQAKGREGFLFDTPAIKKGLVRLTAKGQSLAGGQN